MDPLSNRGNMDAPEEVLSFKMHVFRPDIHDWEIRRFYIHKCIAYSYKSLCEELQNYFPTLQWKKFNLEWIDNDKDTITIGPDSAEEEMEIAITEMISRTNICEFKVKMFQNRESSKPSICTKCRKESQFKLKNEEFLQLVRFENK